MAEQQGNQKDMHIRPHRCVCVCVCVGLSFCLDYELPLMCMHAFANTPNFKAFLLYSANRYYKQTIERGDVWVRNICIFGKCIY